MLPMNKCHAIIVLLILRIVLWGFSATIHVLAIIILQQVQLQGSYYNSRSWHRYYMHACIIMAIYSQIRRQVDNISGQVVGAKQGSCVIIYLVVMSLVKRCWHKQPQLALTQQNFAVLLKYMLAQQTCGIGCTLSLLTPPIERRTTVATTFTSQYQHTVYIHVATTFIRKGKKS